jgi:hypothetical protein
MPGALPGPGRQRNQRAPFLYVARKPTTSYLPLMTSGVGLTESVNPLADGNDPAESPRMIGQSPVSLTCLGSMLTPAEVLVLEWHIPVLSWENKHCNSQVFASADPCGRSTALASPK